MEAATQSKHQRPCCLTAFSVAIANWWWCYCHCMWFCYHSPVCIVAQFNVGPAIGLATPPQHKSLLIVAFYVHPHPGPVNSVTIVTCMATTISDSTVPQQRACWLSFSIIFSPCCCQLLCCCDNCATQQEMLQTCCWWWCHCNMMLMPSLLPHCLPCCLLSVNCCLSLSLFVIAITAILMLLLTMLPLSLLYLTEMPKQQTI